MTAPTLALPPPRFTLLALDVAGLERALAREPQQTHQALCRALAYETTLQPTEKDTGRRVALNIRAIWTEGVLKHRRVAA
jgi:hypothetical protein